MMKRQRILFVPVLIVALVVALLTAGFAGAQDDSPPFLGVGVEASDDGALVAEVVPGGPAAEAGLEVGDVITAINDEAVTADSIRDVLSQHAVGDTVTLSVQRGDETLTLEVTLAARPAEEPDTNIQVMPGVMSLFGLQAEQSEDGLVIREVTPDSPAAEAGFEVGDVVTKVGETDITNMADVMTALSDVDPTQPLTVEVLRGGETVSLELSLGDFVIPFNDGEGRGFEMPFGMPFGMMGGGARLGVAFVTLDETTAQERGVEQTEGALITEVVEDSPAAEAGLQVDDIVTAVDGDVVDAERTLRDRLLAYEPGDTVTLTVLRGGETLEVEVTLDEADMSGMMMPRGFRFFGPDGFVHPPIPDMPGQPDDPEATVQPNA